MNFGMGAQMYYCESRKHFRLVAVFAYILAITYWLVYFLKGSPTFTANDWLKEQVFSNVLRDALLNLQIPFAITPAFYHPVQEFMANPEVSLAPDVLLLTVLPNNFYFLAHWLIFFTIGFFGLVLLAKKCKIGALPFLFMVTLFNANGYISSHISEGHIQWAGYFLTPLFFYWLSSFGEERQQTALSSALKIGLLLGFMFLNGSFHVAVWCLMFSLFVLAYKPDLFKPIGLVFLVSAGLGLCRLLPAAIYFSGAAGKEFVSGYPSFDILLSAMTFVYDPSKPTTGGAFGRLKWWEYSLYIGYIGFFFIVTGVYSYLKNKVDSFPRPWIPAALIMFVLSLGDVFQIIPSSGLPFSTLERVAPRFIIIPFVVVLFISAVGVTRLQDKYGRHVSLLLAISFVSMMGEIFQNARKWRIESYEQVMGTTTEIPAVSIDTMSSGMLQWIVVVSWLVSFSVATIVSVWLWRLRAGRVDA